MRSYRATPTVSQRSQSFRFLDSCLTQPGYHGTMIKSLFVIATAALIVCVAPAAAATPSATTGPVTAVGPSTATVTGSVNPNGAATTWYAEYGKTTGYGSKSASKSAGSGTAAVAISAGLTGLAAGTTYH